MSLEPKDLLINPYNTSKSGWVENYKGIRLYHKPTGIEIVCEKYNSQHRNKAECLRLLEEELCYLQKEDYNGQ